jgi:hypothetical protein
VVLRRFFEVGPEHNRVAGEVETVVAVGSSHSGVQGGSRGVVVGGLCACCAHLGGAGQTAVWWGQSRLKHNSHGQQTMMLM